MRPVDEDFLWAILGLTLVIIELLSGTFYLLVLGIAAFGAALAAWLGQGFPVQAIVAAAISGLGCYGVHVYRAKNATEQMPNVDAGQPASFENWVDQGARLARVRYRGASWDALVEGDAAIDVGAMLYVVTANGNTLKVTNRRPA
ncbi:MAG: NfeD family protein [Betaproteobacteria bacterium]|nr:NfeD family protein [Betaproteobacteria bacterium]